MTYKPLPGSIPFKVIEYLKTLQEGKRIAVAPLATAIECRTDAIIPCMVPAVKAGEVKKEKVQGLVYFSLGDGVSVLEVDDAVLPNRVTWTHKDDSEEGNKGVPQVEQAVRKEERKEVRQVLPKTKVKSLPAPVVKRSDKASLKKVEPEGKARIDQPTTPRIPQKELKASPKENQTDSKDKGFEGVNIDAVDSKGRYYGHNLPKLEQEVRDAASGLTYGRSDNCFFFRRGRHTIVMSDAEAFEVGAFLHAIDKYKQRS